MIAEVLVVEDEDGLARGSGGHWERATDDCLDRYFRAEEDPKAQVPKNFMQGFLEVSVDRAIYTDKGGLTSTTGPKLDQDGVDCDRRDGDGGRYGRVYILYRRTMNHVTLSKRCYFVYVQTPDPNMRTVISNNLRNSATTTITTTPHN